MGRVVGEELPRLRRLRAQLQVKPGRPFDCSGFWPRCPLPAGPFRTRTRTKARRPAVERELRRVGGEMRSTRAGMRQ